MTRVIVHKHAPPSTIYETAISTGPMAPFSRSGGGVDGSFAPPFEVRERDDCFELEADVPGVKASDLRIFVHGNVVTISGQRSARPASDNSTYQAYERTYGTFWRAFRLLPGIRSVGVRAGLSDGVLTLSLPKRQVRSAHPVAIAV